MFLGKVQKLIHTKINNSKGSTWREQNKGIKPHITIIHYLIHCLSFYYSLTLCIKGFEEQETPLRGGP